MTRHSKKDANHDAIVARFQALGCSVIEMHATGIPGMPDLAIGLSCPNGRITQLVEVKNPETAYGRRGLNANQTAFARDWRGGKIWTVTGVDEATALVQNWRSAA
ncbi:hypothetical protein SAMN04487785_1146 [Dyella jiangningensis]|uniref:hypothetical protein n=1 Tax=Dyella sp. AtDHG13 TaxID=1938897 RepID=UPI00087EB3C9|nr:hypothetical protein [Dyella sp. AtDHG13]PXV54214.1 hypothetical protein BDW41_113167 [Dyella sp. AtDHG13]SDL03769.1 hypothetical protein SAMN04487785_1146 [Dyella jiangningensis]